VPHAHFVTTTTHKTLRGPRGGLILIGNDTENTLGIKAAKSGRVKRFGEIIDSNVMPGIQGGPLMHIIAAKGVAFKEAQTPAFADYQKQIVANARALAAALEAEGARIISGGTDNHLMLVDVTPFDITGKEAELALDRANITVNKNAIPFDTRSPMVTSGIRLGTPALTTRGMRESDMETVASLIIRVLSSGGDDAVIEKVGEDVKQLSSRFALYPEIPAQSVSH